MIHFCKRRALSAGRFNRSDIRVLALKHDFNRTVFTVADPPGHGPLICMLIDVVSKTYALNTAVDM